MRDLPVLGCCMTLSADGTISFHCSCDHSSPDRKIKGAVPMVHISKFSGSSERKEGLVEDNDFVSLLLVFTCLTSVTGRP